MKKATKRLLAAFLALAMVFTLLAVPATSMKDVSAATSKTVYINPYSDRVVSYKPGRVTQTSGVISIVGCTKASQIKKLKCSNKNMKVSAKDGYKDGYIRVDYGKKAGKATITCTVKGVKLKTTFTVKKYTNPVSSIKIGSKNYTSSFAKNTYTYTSKKVSKKTLSVKAKKGWTIKSVSVYNGKSKHYDVNKSSYSKKITLSKKSSGVIVVMYQKSTGLTESLMVTYR